ncbi:hypothetical protein TcasGA2_TC000211 [Tribolium castaneum]|uniref:Uncharacterized protein n=1 Tax=Tribolium castaneum TaxID=7070 RepID=D6WC67_TRICA|nr:hypothetical protein TcasGA2_TC000211 [Tribolium castaneum]
MSMNIILRDIVSGSVCAFTFENTGEHSLMLRVKSRRYYDNFVDNSFEPVSTKLGTCGADKQSAILQTPKTGLVLIPIRAARRRSNPMIDNNDCYFFTQVYGTNRCGKRLDDRTELHSERAAPKRPETTSKGPPKIVKFQLLITLQSYTLKSLHMFRMVIYGDLVRVINEGLPSEFTPRTTQSINNPNLHSWKKCLKRRLINARLKIKTRYSGSLLNIHQSLVSAKQVWKNGVTEGVNLKLPKDGNVKIGLSNVIFNNWTSSISGMQANKFAAFRRNHVVKMTSAVIKMGCASVEWLSRAINTRLYQAERIKCALE